MSSSDNNITFKKTSFLSGINSEFINKYYSDYLTDPKSLPESWKKFFDGLSEDEKIILVTDDFFIWLISILVPSTLHDIYSSLYFMLSIIDFNPAKWNTASKLYFLKTSSRFL